MPQLKDFRNSKTISLPSMPDSKIEICGVLLVGQSAEIMARDKEDEVDVEKLDKEEMFLYSLENLPYFIKSWNFTEDNGDPMPITRENLNFLKQEDFAYLTKEIEKMIDEGKKKDDTTSGSSPSATK